MSEPVETKEISDKTPEQESRSPTKKRGSSLFFPVLLIAAGVMLLLSTLDLLPELNWQAAFQLWPLLLIFIGLDIVVRVVPRPLGTILSLLIALAAVGIFGFVLLFADDVKFLDQFYDESEVFLKTEQLSYAADGVERADVSLELGPQPASLTTLEKSDFVIEAEVSYVGDLVFETSTTSGLAAVDLETQANTSWPFWINPVNWFADDEDNRWQIGLAPDIPMNLDLHLGSGSALLGLDGLNLSNVIVDGSSGMVEIVLPDGDFNMDYESGSGSMTMTLPRNGRHEFSLESGSGRVLLLVPSSMEVVVTVEELGSGGLDIDDSRLSQIESGEDGQDVWATGGHSDTRDLVELLLHTGSGKVTIQGE